MLVEIGKGFNGKLRDFVSLDERNEEINGAFFAEWRFERKFRK